MTATKISVIIPTYKEEINIRSCIESVQWASEILVVDAHSTDATLDLCRKTGVRIIPFSVQQRFCEPQRWVGIQEAQHEWILCVDADERPSISLVEEIRLTLDSNPSHHGLFLDGKYGFILALLTAMTVLVNHLKLFELQKSKKTNLRLTSAGQDPFANENQKNID